MTILWDGRIMNAHIPFEHRVHQEVFEKDNAVKTVKVYYRQAAPIVFILTEWQLLPPRWGSNSLHTTWGWFMFFVEIPEGSSTTATTRLLSQSKVLPNVDKQAAEASLICHAAEFYAAWERAYGYGIAGEPQPPPEMTDAVEVQKLLRF